MRLRIAAVDDPAAYPDLEKLDAWYRAHTDPLAALDYRTAVICCADARVNPAAFAEPDVLVLENAGNLFDDQAGAIPRGIEQLVFVGHHTVKSDGARDEGCGACAERRKIEGAGDRSAIRNQLPPELFRIAVTVRSTPEENLASCMAAAVNWGYRTAGGFFTNQDATLEGFTGRELGPDAALRVKIQQRNEIYRREVHDEVISHHGHESLGTSQDPWLIHVSKLPWHIGQVFGGKLGHANEVFEAKQGWDLPGLTDITVGTAQYAWMHHRHEESTSFGRAATTLLSTRDSDDLASMVARLDHDPVLETYLREGGRLFGMVLAPPDDPVFHRIA